jgi:hypothetical protein
MYSDHSDVAPLSKRHRSDSEQVGSSSSDAKRDADKWRLQAQDLKVKYGIEKDERLREKERFLRQLEFLEAECNSLKKSAAEKTEKYFEDKRSLMSQIRNLESALSTATAASSSVSTGGVPSSNSVVSTERNGTWVDRLEKLEGEVISKSEELSIVKSRNATLEEKCVQLEQVIVKLNALLSVSSGDPEDRTDYRRKCADLESTVREKNNMVDRLERRLQNQSMLEQEIGTLRTRLAAAKETADTVSSLQSSLQRLQQERDEWAVLFAEVLKPSSAVVVPDTPAAERMDVPLQALRMLKRTQEAAAVSAREAADFESALTSSRRRAAAAEVKCAELEAQLGDARLKLERESSQARLHEQQAQLYERETVSLRKLLKSYDKEFSIGRPEAESMLRSKDETIEGLRAQLDAARTEASAALHRVRELSASARGEPTKEEATVAAPARAVSSLPQTDGGKADQQGNTGASESDNNATLVCALKEEIEKLTLRLLEFQRAFGADFIPSETRVRA